MRRRAFSSWTSTIRMSDGAKGGIDNFNISGILKENERGTYGEEDPVVGVVGLEVMEF